jgi:hypothetical protein
MFKTLLLLLPFIVGIFNTSFLTTAQNKANENQPVDYSAALDYLFNLKSTGEVMEVDSEITLTRDVATFKLLEGKLYPLNDFNGTHYALVFIGKGEFNFTPPGKIEKKQLFRFFDTENYSMEFKELFLLFDDDTYEQLIQLQSVQKFKDASIDRIISNFLRVLKNDDDECCSAFIRSILMQGKNGYFYSQIQESNLQPVFFQIEPFEIEEVSFMRGIYVAAKNYRELINLFPAQYETLSYYSHIKPNKYFLDLISYNINSTIASNLDFSANCTIDFKAIESNQDWITFYLYNELQVDSVKWENRSRAKFVKREESSELWIKCNSEYLDGNQHSISIYYHGDLLVKDALGWIELGSSIYWYPRYDNKEKSSFLLTFHTSSKYQLVSIGDLENTTINEDTIITTWRSPNPSRNASFNIGNFENYEVKKEKIPVVSVYISEYGHQYASSYLRSLGILSLNDASEYIAQDISNSVILFDNIFGSLDLKSLNVTEIPYLHGEAFPGLIHLSWSTVIQSNFEGEDEVFRTHEAAHQWWGIGVDFETYHDQWLSEGLAEYSGIWYLQSAKNDNALFFAMLNDWKDKIINVRQYLLNSGQEAGPVWLGYRTSSSSTKGDYDLIIYKKGAWIIHMLRAMLLDLSTMNEDKMTNLMHDYYETYKNKSASTANFKKIVEKHFGEDMSWFFNQYVYGTDIPLYKVAYKTKKTDDGKSELSLRIRQEQVPEDFKMYVPLKLILENEKVGRFRVEVKGKETLITIPSIEGELEELVFNDLESVLCEVEYEDW